MDKDQMLPQNNDEQFATQDQLIDEGTGRAITGSFIILKDVAGDNHHFKDWNSVARWAQAIAVAAAGPAKADEA